MQQEILNIFLKEYDHRHEHTNDKFPTRRFASIILLI